MIIVMSPESTQSELDAVVSKIRASGLTEHVSRGSERTIVGAIGDERPLNEQSFEQMAGVERAIHIVKPYKLVAREGHPAGSVIDIRGIKLG
ncbi:MAG: hypothetical protein JNM11_06285, partial [Chitinimonas sp.]|nr:hypothetical protein [Chitinimonas sp.]